MTNKKLYIHCNLNLVTLNLVTISAILKKIMFQFAKLTALHYSPPIPEIIWVKNVRAIVVCGFLMK